MKNAWTEINQGADIRLPLIFKIIIQYIAPIYLIGLLILWGVQDGIPVFLMEGKSAADIPYLWGARMMMLGLMIAGFILVYYAYRRGTIKNELKTE